MTSKTLKPDLAEQTVIYAIGDVHGEAERLRDLHDLILERHGLLFGGHPIQLVHLGDYVDRGRDSAGVLETLIALQSKPDMECICLRGNHEEMMLNGLINATPTAYENWLVNGGEQTMASYRKAGQTEVPKRHIAWLEALPNIFVQASRKLIFVHAGINPEDYPNDRDGVYLWTRAQRFFDVSGWTNPNLSGWTVVHGHTPTDDFYPEDQAASARRINIDTGAVFGGRLTAAIFAVNEPVRYIYA